MKRLPPIALVVTVLTVLSLGCTEPKEPGLSTEQTGQFLTIQQTLVDAQAAVRESHDMLAEDRRNWEAHRRHDPIIANSIHSTGVLIACSLPLVVVLVLLWHCRTDDAVPLEADPILLALLAGESQHLGNNRLTNNLPGLPEPRC